MFHFPSRTTIFRLEGFERPVPEPDYLPEVPEAVLVRRATTADAARVGTLARLDDKRQPEGPFLVAEVSGEIVAAKSLSSGTVVADPFRLTSDAVAMLHLRAAQVRGADELAERRTSRDRRSLAQAPA
jgi:hypothetical protein